MGWCSGTEIFDIVAGALLTEDKDEVNVEEALTQLYNVLRDKDWDCVGDSAYYNHPVVREIIKKIEPDWVEDEED